MIELLVTPEFKRNEIKKHERHSIFMNSLINLTGHFRMRKMKIFWPHKGYKVPYIFFLFS